MLRCRWSAFSIATALAAIPSAAASTTATPGFGWFLGRGRFCSRFDGLRFGLGFRFRRFCGCSFRGSRCTRVKSNGSVLRCVVFGNRNLRTKLRKIELRIASGFAAEPRGSLLRLRFPIGAAEAFSSGGVPLRRFGVLAGGLEHTRQLEGNHCVLRFLKKCR